MIQVTFHPFSQIPDSALRFAVIAARYEGKWIFCRHRERSTWEIPGGHREPGEPIAETARRELREETGCVSAELRPLCVYGVIRSGEASYGGFFLAEVQELAPLDGTFEIREILLSDALPRELTYPDIQPHLFRFAQEALNDPAP